MYNNIKMDNKILTTISGSLPKPNWLAEPEKLWSPWLLQGEELKKGKRDAIKIAVNDQINSGLSIIGDGEQTRQHFVTTFIEHLNGVDFKNQYTEIELYIDGQLSEKIKLPADFTTRRHEIGWNYQLGNTAHKIKLKRISQDPDSDCFLSEMITYTPTK